MRRHFTELERWSSIVLAMGVGHWLFSSMGSAGLAAALVVVFLSACFRVYLTEVAKRRTT